MNFNISKGTKSYMVVSFIVMVLSSLGIYFLVDQTVGLLVFIVLTVAWYFSILRLEQNIVVSNGEIPSFEWMDDDKLYNVLELPGCPDPAKIFNYNGLLGAFENDDFQDFIVDSIHNGHPTVLPILYGKKEGDELLYGDLVQAPSLLIAGISGSGKSTLLHQILATLLTYNKPNNLHLYLCDTKRVELHRYANFPHTQNIIYEHEQVDAFLEEILQEINRRYRYFNDINVTSIAEYNKLKLGEKMRLPYLVVVIEELGDIMLGADKDVQIKLIKILQKGRSSGTHVITLTQRPSAQIISSSIKANIPNRVALRVSSAIDSRIILEQNGAENLVNVKGEMLVLDGGKLEYAISMLVTADEIKKLEQAWQ